MGSLTRKAAIVGINEFPALEAPGYTIMGFEAECAIKALDDAGLTFKDVDGYFGNTAPVDSMKGVTMCDYLGINPAMVVDSDLQGASPSYGVLQAAAHINAGLINVALITYGLVVGRSSSNIGTGSGLRRPAGPSRAAWWTDAFHTPFGIHTIASYAQVAQRHMYTYGTTSEQLAEIAVSTRYHGSLNPQAKFRNPIVVEDVLNSRMISSPLHLLDCSVVQDGGGAIVVASEEVARNCKRTPVWFLGGFSAIEHRGAGYRDYTSIAAARSGPRALAEAGVTHKEIDMAMIYDSFTITVLSTLEGLGFCKPGEGGAFVSGGRLRLDGELPTNTDGGALSYNDGARGILLLIEATQQLRGEAGDAQVKDCRIALTHATGGQIGTEHTAVTLVLARD